MASVISCGPGGGDVDLRIMFIPSKNPLRVKEASNRLQELINTDTKLNLKSEVTVGASYEAAAEALKAGSVDIAFLPYDTVKSAGGIKYILMAVRNTMKWDEANPEKGGPLIDGFNSPDQNVHSLYEKLKPRTEALFTYREDGMASWYRSQIMTKTNDEITQIFTELWKSDEDKNGELSTSEIAKSAKLKSLGANENAITTIIENKIELIYTAITSSASYVRAIEAIQRVPGLKSFKIQNVKDSQLTKSTGYEDSFKKLKASNSGWAAMGIFSGVDDQEKMRKAFTKDITKAKFLEDTKIIAVSKPIINDGIQIAVDTRLSKERVKSIVDFFIRTIQIKEHKNNIYKIYSHSNYSKKVQATNDAVS